MNTISEMPNDALSKSVDAFASAVEAYIGNEAGLDATRSHVAMLREAARRLSARGTGKIIAPPAWLERMAKLKRDQKAGA